MGLSEVWQIAPLCEAAEWNVTANTLLCEVELCYASDGFGTLVSNQLLHHSALHLCKFDHVLP